MPVPVLPSSNLISSFLPLDWAKITEGALGSIASGAALYFFGKRAQKWREKTDTRTNDQKAIDQLMGRVGKLETDMATANAKIEDLRTEKMQLQVEIVSLRKDIALLEVKKAEFESREAKLQSDFESREIIFNAQLAALQQRLDAKTAELMCAETKLRELEQKEQQKEQQKVHADAPVIAP